MEILELYAGNRMTIKPAVEMEMEKKKQKKIGKKIISIFMIYNLSPVRPTGRLYPALDDTFLQTDRRFISLRYYIEENLRPPLAILRRPL